MDNAEFQRVRAEFNTICEGILDVKGEDYTVGNQEENKLYNFEQVGALLAGEVDYKATMVVASIYWLKHVFAIMAYVRSGKEGSEPMTERFADARNYIDLMYAIYKGKQDVDAA